MLTIGRKDGKIEKLSLAKITQKQKVLPTHTVIGGEFAVALDGEDVALKTLLGSCVALMFYDRKRKIKAMNHFLLPETSDNSNDMKYGLYSVEAMLNEMYKQGCSKSDIVAKISGGADIMNLNLKTLLVLEMLNLPKNFVKKRGLE